MSRLHKTNVGGVSDLSVPTNGVQFEYRIYFVFKHFLTVDLRNTDKRWGKMEMVDAGKKVLELSTSIQCVQFLIFVFV